MAAHKIAHRKMKQTILDAYGKICACCREKKHEFLSIDHIHGGGAKHIKSLRGNGWGFYRWLIKNNFPQGYRVLCMNCNFALGHFGYCPHRNPAVVAPMKG